MSQSEYECALCHRMYGRTWTDEEARAEFEQAFPGEPFNEAELVCDACYKEVMDWAKANPQPVKPPSAS